MKRTLTRRAFLVATGCAVGIPGPGCKLQRAGLPARTFLLQAPGATPGSRVKVEAGGRVLMVRPFRVVPAFDARAFVVRRSESEYVSDAYDAFLLSPGPMLTEAVAEWLRTLHAFASVVTGGSQVIATHALEGEVPELFADYRDLHAPKAVLAVQLRLLQLQGKSAPILWQRLERRAIDLPRASADALVAGWNQALAGICQAFETSFAQ